MHRSRSLAAVAIAVAVSAALVPTPASARGASRVVFMGDSVADAWQPPRFGTFSQGRPSFDRFSNKEATFFVSTTVAEKGCVTFSEGEMRCSRLDVQAVQAAW